MSVLWEAVVQRVVPLMQNSQCQQKFVFGGNCTTFSIYPKGDKLLSGVGWIGHFETLWKAEHLDNYCMKFGTDKSAQRIIPITLVIP